ncbi:DUF202 domain-containing protein [Demequina sp. NBRC 110051]|uniref:DUF202 domain-containing protein n=1 Tax=Demequina sp. NBRC 110051 TaxID=1570340 RepID=UPI000A00498F|nr:DUF202 domain-containing protein [Demequina sp. NBRC 110051]
MTPPRDPGLQPERTALAWRRTALAMAVGSVVAARVLPHAMGDMSWVLAGIGGVVASGVVAALGQRRYRHLHGQGATAVRRGGGDLLVVACLVTTGAIVLAVAAGLLATG